MMFINDLDALNANMNGALYRQHNGVTSTTNSLQQQSLDAALHLQSNSLTFACQQKISPPIPQTTISYSTSRQELTPSSSNIYSSSMYSTSDQTQQVQNQQTISNLIPLNITIYNPALSCNYSPTMLTAPPQYSQVATIPSFNNFNTYPQKYVYKTKADDYSDYQYGIVTKTNFNKYYSKTNSQPYYLNQQRAIHQQDNNNNNNNIVSSTASTESSSNNIYLTNSANTTTRVLTSLDVQSQPTLIPIRASIQQLNSNTRLIGIKKRKKRFKKPIELRKVLPKNSLMLLHELMPNVEYRFVKQSGPIHKPIFTMSVDISQHNFEGTGKTKKEARMMAADHALKFLMEFPEYIQKTKSNKDSEPNSVDKYDDVLTDDDEGKNSESDVLMNNLEQLNEINDSQCLVDNNGVDNKNNDKEDSENKSIDINLETIYNDSSVPIVNIE